MPSRLPSFCSRLGGDSSLGVGDLDAQCLCLCNDIDSLSGGNSVADLGSVCSVVHEQEFDISWILNEESLVAGWHHVSGLLVGTEADLKSDLSAYLSPNAMSLSPMRDSPTS